VDGEVVYEKSEHAEEEASLETAEAFEFKEEDLLKSLREITVVGVTPDDIELILTTEQMCDPDKHSETTGGRN